MAEGAEAIAAGRFHSMVLKKDGSVWATGHNDYGQLGDGTTIDRWGFIQVMAEGAESIAAGGWHSMVLKKDGSVWVTGDNDSGQLGEWSTWKRTKYARITGVFDLRPSHRLSPCARLTAFISYCANNRCRGIVRGIF